MKSRTSRPCARSPALLRAFPPLRKGGKGTGARRKKPRRTPVLHDRTARFVAFNMACRGPRRPVLPCRIRSRTVRPQIEECDPGMTEIPPSLPRPNQADASMQPGIRPRLFLGKTNDHSVCVTQSRPKKGRSNREADIPEIERESSKARVRRQHSRIPYEFQSRIVGHDTLIPGGRQPSPGDFWKVFFEDFPKPTDAD
jgi:hypothetical protein